MNGDGSLPNNSKVIHFVVGTVCFAALIAVGTQAWCYINKIPDMNTPLAGAFIHVTDTLVGALIAMLINTRPASQQKPEDGKPLVVAPVITPEGQIPVKVEQPKGEPIPVVTTPSTPPTTPP